MLVSNLCPLCICFICGSFSSIPSSLCNSHFLRKYSEPMMTQDLVVKTLLLVMFSVIPYRW